MSDDCVAESCAVWRATRIASTSTSVSLGALELETMTTRGGRVAYDAVTLTLQVTPKRSVSIPKPALHADAAKGSTMVASTARAFQ